MMDAAGMEGQAGAMGAPKGGRCQAQLAQHAQRAGRACGRTSAQSLGEGLRLTGSLLLEGMVSKSEA